MGGCRPNTMLWHKLRRSDPKSMAALMAIADKYALAEEAGKAPADISPAPARRDNNKPAEHKPEGGSHGSRRDNYRGKRHSDQPGPPIRFMCDAVCGPCDARAATWRRAQTGRQWKPSTQRQRYSTAVLVSQRQEPLQPHHPRLPLHEAADKRRATSAPTPPSPSRRAGRPSRAREPASSTTRLTKCNMADIWPKMPTYIIFTSEPEDKTSRRAVPSGSARSFAGPRSPKRSNEAITFDRRDTGLSCRSRNSYAMVSTPPPPQPARRPCCQPIGRITLEVMFGKPDHFRKRIEFEPPWTLATRKLKIAPDAGHRPQKQLIHAPSPLARPRRQTCRLWATRQDDSLPAGRQHQEICWTGASVGQVSSPSVLARTEIERLTGFLRENRDIFAWTPRDMPGVPRELAEHLHVRPDAKPVKQPLRRFAEERRKAIGEEIARLLAAGFIMEVLHPDWLANPVLVLKKNDSWRMCIDYTSLNKACPKDPFPLPRIDQVIDSTAGCELLSFLDAYSGYHQSFESG
ncbi:hypothetical protein QYE76_065960 [Lolium multiflorum]|uniref:Uncharacterized protein n=1 Tax=Lolium multiflorum TaxID=4521 RepID=A0AAD8WAE4_LOLMU|nr:hypothetical protein QYE76_065960 [Lolium multiflorum]